MSALDILTGGKLHDGPRCSVTDMYLSFELFSIHAVLKIVVFGCKRSS